MIFQLCEHLPAQREHLDHWSLGDSGSDQSLMQLGHPVLVRTQSPRSVRSEAAEDIIQKDMYLQIWIFNFYECGFIFSLIPTDELPLSGFLLQRQWYIH